jgi:hypothetical protein
MALPASGQLSMSDINTELGNTSTAQITLNDTNVRTLLQRTSAQTEIGMNAGYSKYYEPVPRAFVQFYSFIMNNYVASGFNGYIHKYITVNKDTFTATDAGNLADLSNYQFGADIPTTSYGIGADRNPWLSIPGSNTGLIFGTDATGSGKTFLIRVTPSSTSMTTIKNGGASDGSVYPYAAGYGPAGYIYSTGRAQYLGGQRYVNISPNLSSWTTTQVPYLLFNYVGTPNAYTATASPVGSNWIIQSSTNGTSWTNRVSLPGVDGASGAYGAGTIVYAQCYFGSGTVNIYRSTNDGVSWTNTNFQLPENVSGDLVNPTLLYAGNGTFVLIASATSGILHRYVCRSTDKGASWTYTKYTNFVTGAAYAQNYEGFSATDGNIVYVAAGSVKQSLDFGVTWTTKTIPQTFTPGKKTVDIIYPIF